MRKSLKALTAGWIPYSKGLLNFNYHCSNCKNLADEANDGTYSILTNYCSNCGARMKNGGKKNG